MSSKPHAILGISPLAHESSAALLVDGVVVAAAAEERFTRVKNQGGFPHRAVDYVLGAGGISASELSAVAYPALPTSVERARDLRHFAQNSAFVATTSLDARSKAAHLANYARGLAKRYARFESEIPTDIISGLAEHGVSAPIEFVDHHEAHCATAYFASGIDRCLAVSLDGYGSGYAGSFYHCEGGKMRLLAGIPYPHSLGTFYRRVTQALGFKPNRHEGKIVGLAAFGDPDVLVDRVMKRVDLDDPSYFRLKASQDPYFEAELAKTYRREDVAAAYQRVLEHIATTYVARWVERTGLTDVVCAGGVFANVKMNQRIMELPAVRSMFVYPNMGDGGVGLGAALVLESNRRGLTPKRLHDVYLGPGLDERECESALRRAGIEFSRPADLESTIVDYLASGHVVARCDGRMEFGPRALGHRSILYPATDASVNRWLNDRLRRTEFMPFAPISLASEADALYEGIGKVRHSAEFMTVTTNCTARMRSESPAAVHVDGTARPQLVRAEVEPKVHRILELYRRRTGIPTLINTSYNMHEEPIVCSAEDAVRAFLDGALEVLALGPFVAKRDVAKVGA